MPNNQGQNRNRDGEREFRFVIAKWVLPIGMGGVLVLALVIAIVSFIADGTTETPRWILTSILPVFGAWVGTILAYYFAKENFESASRNAVETAEKFSMLERLKSVPARSKMVVRQAMIAPNITTDRPIPSIRIVGDILDLLENEQKNRLPVLDDRNHPKYMIHRSMIDKYLTRKITRDKLATDQLNQLSLQDLLDDDPDLKNLFESSFGVIREDASLADAKTEMDRISQCLDVFVTGNGTRNEPVIGWLTNLIITESAKV
jgi:hypothetical protein